MSDDNNIERESKGGIERISDATLGILRNWKGVVVFIFTALLLTYIIEYVGVPQWLTSLTFATLFLSPFFLFVASPIVNWLVDDNRIKVGVVDAATGEKVEGHKIPRQIWEEKNIEEGKVHYNDAGKAIVRDIDWNGSKLSVTNSWFGEVTDTRLMTALENIRANREKIRDWAIYGHEMYAKHETIIDEIKAEIYKDKTDSKIEAIHGSDAQKTVEDVNNRHTKMDQMTDSFEFPEAPIENDTDDAEHGEKAGEEQ